MEKCADTQASGTWASSSVATSQSALQKQAGIPNGLLGITQVSLQVTARI